MGPGDARPTDEMWASPSPSLLAMRRVELALVMVTVTAATAAGLASGLNGTGATLGWVLAVIGGALCSAAGELVIRRRYRAWGYLERDDDLLVRRGVMFRRLSVVPYGRMQFVDVTAGPAERAFGLATVRLHTAAAASDARIPGLKRHEADRVRDQLAARGEARAAGL